MATYKKGKSHYLIELVHLTSGTFGEPLLVVTFDADGLNPRSFPNRAAAQKRVTEILTGVAYAPHALRAYTIRKFTLLTLKKD